jgi:hypothetical protein
LIDLGFFSFLGGEIWGYVYIYFSQKPKKAYLGNIMANFSQQCGTALIGASGVMKHHPRLNIW